MKDVKDNKIKARNLQLDAYRGLIMIYIVCFIHPIYWLELAGEPIRSFILFEMPVIFFISGAALSVSHTKKGLLETLWNRIRRVAIPFYVYAIVSIFFFFIWKKVWDSPLITKIVSEYSINDFGTVIKLITIPGTAFCWHLWFIFFYLIISVSFCVQQKIIHKVGGIGYLLFCLVAFLVSDYLKRDLLPTLFCYNFFMVCGYVFYNHKKAKEYINMGGVKILFLLLWLFFIVVILQEETFVMQSHKFPPDIIFISYGVICLGLLSVVFSKIKIPCFYLIDRWNKYGYTIYLYQNIVFFIYKELMPLSAYSFNSALFNLMITGTIIFILSSGLTYITIPLESYVLKWIPQLKKR